MHFKRHHSAAVRASLPLLNNVKELELIPGGTALAPGYPEGAALISLDLRQVNSHSPRHHRKSTSRGIATTPPAAACGKAKPFNRLQEPHRARTLAG